MTCDRLQRERLGAVEDGAPPDEHEQTCADCAEARRKYLKVGELTAGAHEGRELPAAWFDATLAMIEARPQHRRRRRLAIGAAGLLAAAAALAVLLWPRHHAVDTAPVLAVRIDRGGAPLRGSAPHPGDLLVLRAQGGGRRHIELRVYRSERELVLRCAEGLACSPSGDRVNTSIELSQAGRYRAILLATDRELPSADTTLDQAAAQVSNQGGVATLSEAIDVL